MARSRCAISSCEPWKSANCCMAAPHTQKLHLHCQGGKTARYRQACTPDGRVAQQYAGGSQLSISTDHDRQSIAAFVSLDGPGPTPACQEAPCGVPLVRIASRLHAVCSPPLRDGLTVAIESAFSPKAQHCTCSDVVQPDTECSGEAAFL